MFSRDILRHEHGAKEKKSVLYVYDETNSITLLKRLTQREIDRYIQSMTLIFIVDYYKWGSVMMGPDSCSTKRVRLPPTYHFNILKAGEHQVFQQLTTDTSRPDHQYTAWGDGVGELFTERSHQLCHCRLGVSVARTSSSSILRGGKRPAVRAHAQSFQRAAKKKPQEVLLATSAGPAELHWISCF